MPGANTDAQWPPCLASTTSDLDRTRRQLRAADAAVVHRAHGVDLAAAHWRSCTARAATRGRRPTPRRGGSRRRWSRAGVGRGDTVAAMLANTPEMIECHFGVPMTGGVLNTLNTRLDAEAIAFMLDHGEAKVLITDTEFAPTIAARARARRRRSRSSSTSSMSLGPGGDGSATIDYETFIADGDPAVRVAAARPTSGTRSRSTTRRAPPAIRRASSITIAART